MALLATEQLQKPLLFTIWPLVFFLPVSWSITYAVLTVTDRFAEPGELGCSRESDDINSGVSRSSVQWGCAAHAWGCPVLLSQAAHRLRLPAYLHAACLHATYLRQCFGQRLGGRNVWSRSRPRRDIWGPRWHPRHTGITQDDHFRRREIGAVGLSAEYAAVLPQMTHPLTSTIHSFTRLQDGAK